MAIKEKDLRVAIVAQCRALNAAGSSLGTAGNISARIGEKMLITPSAVPYDLLRPEMIAAMPLDGEYGAWSGPMKPSTEWRFHLDIMRARPDIGAIVHNHPPYGCALAMLHKPILAAHYMIALFGGPIDQMHVNTRPTAPRNCPTSSSRGSATATRCCSAITARSPRRPTSTAR